jgi:hypothetical protein
VSTPAADVVVQPVKSTKTAEALTGGVAKRKPAK